MSNLSSSHSRKSVDFLGVCRIPINLTSCEYLNTAWYAGGEEGDGGSGFTVVTCGVCWEADLDVGVNVKSHLLLHVDFIVSDKLFIVNFGKEVWVVPGWQRKANIRAEIEMCINPLSTWDWLTIARMWRNPSPCSIQSAMIASSVSPSVTIDVLPEFLDLWSFYSLFWRMHTRTSIKIQRTCRRFFFGILNCLVKCITVPCLPPQSSGS